MYACLPAIPLLLPGRNLFGDPTRAVESTTQALGQTRTAVDELSRMAADLRTTVGRFTS